MHVNVPQFIDIEDKIAFGLTAKQLLWMGGMGATLLVIYNLFDQQSFYLIGIFVVIIFSTLAFWRPQGVSLITFIGFMIQFYLKPRNYIWRRIFHPGDIAAQKAARDLQMRNIPQVQHKKNISRSELKKIAWMLDTKK